MMEDRGRMKSGYSQAQIYIRGEAIKTQLKNDDRVLGYVYKGQARVYPIKILNWHEIVNGRFAGASRVVIYCPLCGTGMVFETEVINHCLTLHLEFRACSNQVTCCLQLSNGKPLVANQIGGGDLISGRLPFKSTSFHTYELGELEIQAPENRSSI